MIGGLVTLRTRLLRLLRWPLAAALLMAAVVHYALALDRARDEQDLALQRVAIALASRLDVDADDLLDNDLAAHLERTMASMQRAESQADTLYFQVRSDSGTALGGDAALGSIADAAAGAGATFTDRRWDGREVRVVTLPHRAPIGDVRIVVAETTQRRAAQARRVLADTFVPELLLFALTLLLVRTGVQRAMQPLDRLSRDVAARAPDDLSPLPADRLPGELMPLVLAINQWMLRVKAAAAAQQTFLSHAAHQLRTPLSGMQTQLELAARDAHGLHRQKLDRVLLALHRITHLTHQMLALARSGPQAVQPETWEAVDLQRMLEDAASTWLDSALARQVDLGFDARPGRAHGSPWMLRELLDNLIDNALRHSPRGGSVTVSSGQAGDVCWLGVEDEGPGVPLAERARVLERFYQAPGAAPGGTGLGLAIVLEVTQRHGGRLTLDDGSGGRGLRVRVEWPAAADERAAPSTTPIAITNPQLETKP